MSAIASPSLGSPRPSVGSPEPAPPSGRRRTTWRVAAIGSLAAIGVLIVYLLFFSGAHSNHYKLLFQNAGQLVPGNEVQIGGVAVGSVDNIRLTDDSLAEVSISLDQELHDGTSAIIRATSPATEATGGIGELRADLASALAGRPQIGWADDAVDRV